MSYEVSVEQLNSAFLQKTASAEGRNEIQQKVTNFTRLKIKEESFARKIVPPEKVTPNTPGMQVSKTQDQFEMIVELEIDSIAMPLSLIGSPTERYVKGKRFGVKFFKIGSERFRKSEIELMTYRHNIKDVITRNSIRDIEKVEDGRFMLYTRKALKTTSKVIGTSVDWRGNNFSGISTAAGGAKADGARLNKDDLTKLFNLIDGDELKSSLLLMNILDFNSIGAWDASELGFSTTDETTKDGYKYNKLLDHLLVVTNKVKYVVTGKVYCFVSPEFLGKFYQLQDIAFFIKKEEDMLTWSSWEVLGMGFQNVLGIAMLDLYTYQSAIGVGTNVLEILNRGELADMVIA